MLENVRYMWKDVKHMKKKKCIIIILLVLFFLTGITCLYLKYKNDMIEKQKIQELLDKYGNI